ncbi:cytochrome ubiquinol oxidase subunit I [Acidithiobacillus sp. CV18-2]|uniref:Cytochrome ubiquinol oxidase subunit I n=1 Tax=Igneacidithiobacillus copahuensis TaxID=2724909 RepID=A0AAE3CJY6_9PROT|nr:cytochrome ubiquinol oxidase subunit I [Igneacidithiobacillus copahuensis]MBU2753758.1 cytochrome ubiquinol oxidase subunit I [Acidithiobacillus sp. CV18-3]MBU2756544.1 cytochrome ubiquinol oxidase subunit I [Acidithiobacillus sp. BN09-2]MBU2776479.1 cytochrome ubiquinol oxidase subunit I [Acidithiobacillus sp. CV18-2]MBU2795183.1 cytochrome ubiquinol oxidase subunit I [Acidithiobacillus sp. VAN18-2]MBU2799189.1 cytochrome ubiquinol oxidase subunit I [Acidithiobacillus sp. VAN18-4]UTV81218
MIIENSLPVLLSRLDFAWITTMHILWTPLTIGMSWLLFFLEIAWLRTGDERWYKLNRFFEKIFIINFGAGVATGVTMEMAFGILYGPFSQAAGPFFGNILGFETITAFMYEAGFIGLMVFGWGKVSKGMHAFATFNVGLSSSLSAMWILVANSWMQTPNGVVLKDGLFQVENWWHAILNDNFIWGFPHMWVATVELSLFVMAGVSAWFILKNRNADLFTKMLKPTLLALLIVTPIQIFIGDSVGKDVADTQPTSLAAMEGHYHTYLPDGKPNTSWNLIAIPNANNDGNLFQISIPHVLSLLETHTWDGVVKGMDQFAPEDRPDVWVPFYSFRVMVAIGFFLFFVALWGNWLRLRGKLSAESLRKSPWFLRAVIFSAFLPYLAIWTGWWVREIGRQPWVVYGQMRTYQGVSHMSVAQEVIWFAGYIVFELLVWAGAWYFFARVIAKGVDGIAPSDQLFHHGEEGDAHAGGGHAQASFAKPMLKAER